MISQRALEVIAEKAAEGDAAIAVVIPRDDDWRASLNTIADLLGGGLVAHSTGLIQWGNNSSVRVLSSRQENADRFKGCRYDLLVFDTNLLDMSEDAHALLCLTAKRVFDTHSSGSRQGQPERKYTLQYIHLSDEGLLRFYGKDGEVTADLDDSLLFTLEEALDFTEDKCSWILRKAESMDKISRKVVREEDLLNR